MRRWRHGNSRPPPRHRKAADDIGPAIREGEPFTDDFEKCDAKWARLIAGARFEDKAAPRF